MDTLAVPAGSPGPCRITRSCGFDIDPPANVSDSFYIFEFR